MATSIMDAAPFIPSDRALASSPLPDKAMTLMAKAGELLGGLSADTAEVIRRHMAIINSYYSNLIEGHKTHPHDIRAAQRGDYDHDPAKRDLQLESLAHVHVQNWIHRQALDVDTLYTADFLRAIHREFYSQVPKSLWGIKNKVGEVVDKLVPGEWRTSDVTVGQHIPPEHTDISNLMVRFCETYHPQNFSGDRKVIAAMAAHHRLVWIHPFVDGNGRVARLFTDATLKAIGLESYGVWCLSRGLARTSARYKNLLALADFPRQGNYDGRGALTESGLMTFCDYMLETALDQVAYMAEILDLSKMRNRIERYVQARNDGRVPGCSGQLKPVASRILYHAFLDGRLQRARALELCDMPDRTARRLISQLKSEGLLSETSNKSPLRWEIPEHVEPWYFPNLTPGIG